MYVCMCMYTHTHTYTRMYVPVHVRVCLYVPTCLYVTSTHYSCTLSIHLTHTLLLLQPATPAVAPCSGSTCDLQKTLWSVCLSVWDAGVLTRNSIWRLVFKLGVRVGTSTYPAACMRALPCACVHFARFAADGSRDLNGASIRFVPGGLFRKERLLDVFWTLECRRSNCLIQGHYFFWQILFCTSCRYSTRRVGVQLGLL
jgi:hypothetical protein